MKKMRKIFAGLLAASLFAGALTGCSSGSSGSSSGSAETSAQSAPAQEGGESGSYAGQKIALVGKSAGNAFFEIAAATFVSTVEDEGGTVEIVYPEEATADAQIKAIENLIYGDYKAICLSANDENALQAVLEEAADAGIRVTSFDSYAVGSEVFINQAGTTAVAQALVDAVYDIAGGEGDWAILSATSQATNQNAWIAAMQDIIAADSKYAGLNLVEIAYGDDEAQKSTDQTEALLQNYPDLKVICAPTTVGIAAAAKYLQDIGATCKLTGLGLPSEMEAYTGADDAHSCPYFYLWDMEGLGVLAAYTTMALVAGEVTGEDGSTFTAGSLGEYSVADNNGVKEIVLGEPLEFTPENVSDYAKLY